MFGKNKKGDVGCLGGSERWMTFCATTVSQFWGKWKSNKEAGKTPPSFWRSKSVQGHLPFRREVRRPRASLVRCGGGKKKLRDKTRGGGINDTPIGWNGFGKKSSVCPTLLRNGKGRNGESKAATPNL